MGKKLVIKGADFSTNALEGGVIADITSYFSWSDGKAWGPTTVQNETPGTSTYFKASAALDISAYAGKYLKITIVKFNKSSGSGISGYGNFIKDNESTIIVTKQFDVNDSDVRPSFSTLWDEPLLIPNNAKYLYVSYISDSYISSSGELSFRALILNN